MATMVVLIETDAADVSLDAQTIGQLAELGVTNLALVRDGRTVGMVLEGWAFDPEASAGEAVSLLGGSAGHTRVLRPVAEIGVSAAQQKGALQ